MCTFTFPLPAHHSQRVLWQFSYGQRNLPNKRHIGKQDPYCQVIFNGEKRRTKAIKRGGQHPEWDEEIRFELYEDVDELPQVPGADPPPPPPKANGKGPPKVKGGSFMAVACYAEDIREPDLIGETKVDLTEVLTKGETDGTSAMRAILVLLFMGICRVVHDHAQGQVLWGGVL